MSATPITALHAAPYGLTFHKTAPLRRAGHTTAEQVADLVAAHRNNPDASPLAGITGMGPARITAVCDAIDRWSADGGVTA